MGPSDLPAASPPDPSPGSELSHLPVMVIMNAGSGSKDKAEVRAAVESVLRGAGRQVDILLARRPRDIAHLAEQAAAHPAILAVAGGDGTINTIARVARARQRPLAIIPSGTFNYFARNLGIPLDAAGAAQVIVDGTLRSLPVGQVNGHLFLNNASIGLYRRLIERREVHKQRFGRNRLVALISALFILMSRPRPYRLHLEIDGQPLTLSTLTVFFGRNALQMEQLGLDEAIGVARGEMAVLALREVGRLELLGLALQGALARLEEARNLRQYCAMTVRAEWLDGRNRSIRVAIDGEVVDCTQPLIVETIPDALQVVVPRETSPGS